jgi:eukaryotic-like serine/threonine-protein kinase
MGYGSSSPAVAYGYVYFGSSNYFYCLDALTGYRAWEYAVEGAIVYNSPSISNGTVYITSEGGVVYAFG